MVKFKVCYVSLSHSQVSESLMIAELHFGCRFGENRVWGSEDPSCIHGHGHGHDHDRMT